MKLHEVDLCGQHLYLCLNGQALFDLYDKFGTKGFITDPLKGSGKKSFEAVCYYLFKLSEQGELYQRWQGQTHGPILTEQFFRVNLAPREVAAAKDAILAAIVLGFRREEKETGDLDLGMVELQKKNGISVTRAHWLQLLTQFLRLNLREGLLLTPGQVMDLQTLEERRRGLKREEG